MPSQVWMEIHGIRSMYSVWEDFCVIIKKQEEGFRKMYEPY